MNCLVICYEQKIVILGVEEGFAKGTMIYAVNKIRNSINVVSHPLMWHIDFVTCDGLNCCFLLMLCWLYNVSIAMSISVVFLCITVCKVHGLFCNENSHILLLSNLVHLKLRTVINICQEHIRAWLRDVQVINKHFVQN